jgi:hypothetical protein
MRKSVLMLIAVAVIDLTASERAPAADIARGPPHPVYVPPVAPGPPVPIPYWTGCYVGGNIGGAWSNVDLTDATSVNFSTSNSGFAGGGQIGCDYQAGPWVVGLRVQACRIEHIGVRLWTVPDSAVVENGLALAISFNQPCCCMRRVARPGPTLT